MPYVVSTLANSQIYTDYDKPEVQGSQMSRPAIPKRKVLIKGGARVQGALRTPDGVLTKITDEDAAWLQTNRVFLIHQKGGHVKIVNREVNPDKVAGDLKVDDGEVQAGERVSSGSAQLSVDAGDFEAGGRAAGPVPVEQAQTI